MAKIRVENVKKVFNAHSRNRNEVLKGVSFELPETGLIAIYGKSGSGKTTLLNIIGGLDKQDSGKIYIDGESVKGKTDKIRNEKIGFIFQNYYLESGYTIAEIMRNAMHIAGFKDETEIAKRTEEVLKIVDMERFQNKQGDALSGGQKQRVAIARALIKGADIILADEPTGNLDAENTVKVMDILKGISKTKLVVLVTHELTLIEKYADSRIKIVDGELVEGGELETGFASSTYENAMNGSSASDSALAALKKSGAKHNGRLYHFQNIFRSFRKGGEESLYSTATIFKQIFILATAVILCFFAFFATEAFTAGAETKNIDENSVYVSMDAYTDLRNLDESLYENIDFFETEYREGGFVYGDISALSNISASYTPKAIERGDSFDNLYGTMPEEGEVLVSRSLAETLKGEFRLDELQSDRAVLLIYFEGEYRVSGIVPGGEPAVYLNKADYVNFLGVYDYVGFDANGLFISADYLTSTFTAEICEETAGMNLGDTEARIEIARNSLYKMMDDTSQADLWVQQVNNRLGSSGVTSTAMPITDSKLFVQRLSITRDLTTADIRIYVNADTLENIFVYLKPNLDSLQGGDSNAQFYFEINTEGGEQLSSLNSRLRDRGIATVNIQRIFDANDAEIKEEAASGLTIFYIAVVLLFLIYFFIAKSAGVKNSREYGVFRAIGVNRGNLLFKETVSAFVSDILSYFLFFLIATILIGMRFIIMNEAVGVFIGFAAAFFAASALVLLGIALIPYLFVLWQTPARILAKYDI